MDTESEVSFCCLELKYCERCGALWLRRAESQESYCRLCFAQMKDSPRTQKRKKNRRAAHRNSSRTRDLQGVAEECTAAVEIIGEMACCCDGEAGL
jgi:Zn-finger nucleic acid-binding protein